MKLLIQVGLFSPKIDFEKGLKSNWVNRRVSVFDLNRIAKVLIHSLSRFEKWSCQAIELIVVNEIQMPDKILDNDAKFSKSVLIELIADRN